MVLRRSAGHPVRARSGAVRLRPRSPAGAGRHPGSLRAPLRRHDVVTIGRDTAVVTAEFDEIGARRAADPDLGTGRGRLARPVRSRLDEGNGGGMTGVRRVVPLTFGWEDLPETISIHGGDPQVRYREPVPGVLVQLDGGWLLLDTGFNVPLVRDPFLRRRFHGGSITPSCWTTAGLARGRVRDGRRQPGRRHRRGAEPPAQRPRRRPALLHRPLPRARASDASSSTGCRADRRRRQPRPARVLPHRLRRPGDRLACWPTATSSWPRASPRSARLGHTPGHQSFVIDLDDAARRRTGPRVSCSRSTRPTSQRNIADELSPGGMVGAALEQAHRVDPPAQVDLPSEQRLPAGARPRSRGVARLHRPARRARADDAARVVDRRQPHRRRRGRRRRPGLDGAARRQRGLRSARARDCGRPRWAW